MKSAYIKNYLLSVVCLCSVCLLHAHTLTDSQPVLIISSYSPDSQNVLANISEFIDEYNRLDGFSAIHIENMNCQSFSEHHLWKERMKNILSKYREEYEPKCIIMLGQEAWASFLSQDGIDDYTIPAFTAMASRNAIILYEETDVFESVDIISDAFDAHVQGGFLYDYDVESNIRLIKKLYPETQNIAFISDNTYGGVSLQALVKKEMGKFPDLNLILLDGRQHTIYTIIEELRTLPPNTALLLGTWRIDQLDGYFMLNATYAMMAAAPSVPAFSLTSLGMGYWAIGGYVPNYRNVGADLARQVVNRLSGKSSDIQPLLMPNQLRIDNLKVEELEIDRSLLPDYAEFINLSVTLYQQYRIYIWTALLLFGILIVALPVLLFFHSRALRLKNILVASEAELRAAKEKAEESDRLKSAFLANMSHEIRTPLNAIVGFSNILTSKEQTLESLQKYGEIIRHSSDLLLRLINDVLDISKLETEKVQFTYQNCDIIPLIHTVLYSMEVSEKNSNRFVLYHQCESFELFTDAQRFGQVLINLLSNASKFTKAGIIMVEFEVNAAGDMVLFSVSDTGSGIPEAKRDAVFERFEKLDAYIQGTGLGLSICKMITVKWGGDIWVDTQYTEGARFVFSHPIIDKFQRKDNFASDNHQSSSHGSLSLPQE
jgi:signal transduction histidine kinase